MKPYSLPKHHFKNNGSVYIEYKYRHPDTHKWTPFRFTFDINRQWTTKKDRTYYAKLAVSQLTQDLQSGFNPFYADNPNHAGIPTKILEALDYVIENIELKERSLQSYRSGVRMLKEWLIKKGLHRMDVKHFKKSHALIFLDTQKKDRDWGNKTYNGKKGNLRSVFSFLIERIDPKLDNPFSGIKKLTEIRGKKNRPPTDEQFKRIMDHLELNHPQLYLAASFQFYTFIRPKELTMIQIEDIGEDYVMVYDDVSKNSEGQKAPLPEQMRELLEQFDIFSYPKDFILFHVGLKPAQGKARKRDIFTLRWQKVVKKGLGIDIDFYSLQHYGVMKLLEGGFDLNEISKRKRHSDVQVTLNYIVDHGLQTSLKSNTDVPMLHNFGKSKGRVVSIK